MTDTPNPTTPSDDDAPAAPAAPSSSAPYEERLERLGGEPAPVITPEEFARLQKAGQVHIDSRGRVQATTGPTPKRVSRCANAVPGID